MALKELCNNLLTAHTLVQNMEDKIDKNDQHHQLTIAKTKLQNLINQEIQLN